MKLSEQIDFVLLRASYFGEDNPVLTVSREDLSIWLQQAKELEMLTDAAASLAAQPDTSGPTTEKRNG